MIGLQAVRSPFAAFVLGLWIVGAVTASTAEAGSTTAVGGSFVNKKGKSLGTFQGTLEVMQFRVQGNAVVGDALLDGAVKNKRGKTTKQISDSIDLQFNLGSFAVVPLSEIDFVSLATDSSIGRSKLIINSAAFSYTTGENPGFATPLSTLTALLSSPNPDLNALVAQLNELIAIENGQGSGGGGDETFAELEQEVVELINLYRIGIGLPALAPASAITQQCRQHSQNMADGVVPFGHDGFIDRVDAIDAMISLSSAGENVAAGYPTAESVVQGWLDSPGHLANIEGTWDMTGVGIAVDEDGYPYYTQIFILSN